MDPSSCKQRAYMLRSFGLTRPAPTGVGGPEKAVIQLEEYS
jgi:hypothetical protein